MINERDELADVLAAHQQKVGIRDMRSHCWCGWSGEMTGRAFIEHQADAILSDHSPPPMIPAGAVEELARELFIGDNANQPRETSIQDWRWFEVAHKAQGQVEHYRAMAAHVLAMGYGKVQK